MRRHELQIHINELSSVLFNLQVYSGNKGFVLTLFVLTQNSCRLEQVIFKDSASSWIHKVIMLRRKILTSVSCSLYWISKVLVPLWNKYSWLRDGSLSVKTQITGSREGSSSEQEPAPPWLKRGTLVLTMQMCIE